MHVHFFKIYTAYVCVCVCMYIYIYMINMNRKHILCKQKPYLSVRFVPFVLFIHTSIIHCFKDYICKISSSRQRLRNCVKLLKSLGSERSAAVGHFPMMFLWWEHMWWIGDVWSNSGLLWCHNPRLCLSQGHVMDNKPEPSAASVCEATWHGLGTNIAELFW